MGRIKSRTALVIQPKPGMDLYRGLRVGWMENTPRSLLWTAAEVMDFVAAHVRMQPTIGHHWTTDRRVGVEFATGMAKAGHSYTLREKSKYPGYLFAGIVLRGRVREVGTIPYDGRNTVFPNGEEKEVTLPGGSLVELFEFAVVVIDPDTGDEVMGGTAPYTWVARV